MSGERPQVAAGEQTGAGKAKRWRAPWRQARPPRGQSGRRASPTGAARPRRRRSRAPAAGRWPFPACSTSATKNRNSVAGSAAAMPLATKTPSRRRKARSASTRRRLGSSGWRSDGAGRPAPTRPKVVGGGHQQQGRQQPGQAGNALAEVFGQQGRQGRRQHHAEQAEALAGGGEPGAGAGVVADIGAPGLVGHGSGGEAEVSERQRADQPGRRMLGRRVEQGDEADRERQQRDRHHARARDTVGQPAQPGVDAGVEQAGGRAEWRRPAPAARRRLRHRSAAHGHRSAARRRPAAGQAGRRRGRGRCAWLRSCTSGRSSAARSSGALVRGSSQMAKKALREVGLVDACRAAVAVQEARAIRRHAWPRMWSPGCTSGKMRAMRSPQSSQPRLVGDARWRISLMLASAMSRAGDVALVGQAQRQRRPQRIVAAAQSVAS